MHGGGSTLFSGRGHQQNDLVDLILAQQLLNSSKNNSSNSELVPPRVKKSKREIEIENIKKEVLSLFDS